MGSMRQVEVGENGHSEESESQEEHSFRGAGRVSTVGRLGSVGRTTGLRGGEPGQGLAAESGRRESELARMEPSRGAGVAYW